MFIMIYYPIANQLALFLPFNGGEKTLIASGDQNPFHLDNARFAFSILVISLPIILAFQWSKKGQQLSELAKENIHTELLLLQQQINPHFLFNTLNNIYALCLNKSSKAPKLVLQLSQLLRFVVYKGGKDKVFLNEEAEYLQDYINLQQVRVHEKCKFTIEITKDLPELKISPLLLVIFLENAFKHGIESMDKNAWLTVKLNVTENKLLFYCGNSTVNSHSPTIQICSADNSEFGIGLTNVRRRLALIYPGKNELTIEHSQSAYHVNLILELE
jgi:sensor histidine kinase YesM